MAIMGPARRRRGFRMGYDSGSCICNQTCLIQCNSVITFCRALINIPRHLWLFSLLVKSTAPVLNSDCALELVDGNISEVYTMITHPYGVLPK